MNVKDKSEDLDEIQRSKPAALGLASGRGHSSPGPLRRVAGKSRMQRTSVLLRCCSFQSSENQTLRQSPAQALTSGAAEAGGAGKARGLASQVAVEASRARLGEAGPSGAEVALGTGSPLLRVA